MVQAYEINTRTLGTIYATMRTVFAEVETWETLRGDLVLLEPNTCVHGTSAGWRAELRRSLISRPSNMRGALWTCTACWRTTLPAMRSRVLSPS